MHLPADHSTHQPLSAHAVWEEAKICLSEENDIRSFQAQVAS